MNAIAVVRQAARSPLPPRSTPACPLPAGRHSLALNPHLALDDRAQDTFEVGRGLAEELGYPAELLDSIPYDAAASFAGVGHYLDLVALRPGEAVLALGSTADAFCAALQVGASGCVLGVTANYAELRRRMRMRSGPGWSQLTFTEGRLEKLPVPAASFDAVVSNGSVNRSLRMDEVFAEAARVLRRGGRLATAEIVSERGERAYLAAIEAQGLARRRDPSQRRSAGQRERGRRQGLTGSTAARTLASLSP